MGVSVPRTLILPDRVDQIGLPVEEALHDLLFLFAVRQDLADGLGDEPQGVVFASPVGARNWAMPPGLVRFERPW
jgi:hypothetical protein